MQGGDSAAPKIGLIGLGGQGLKIAHQLADGGCMLAVHDTNPVCLADAHALFERKNVSIMADTKLMLERG